MRALAGTRLVVATAVLAVADDGWQRPPARRSSRCRQPSINACTTSAAAITTSCRHRDHPRRDLGGQRFVDRDAFVAHLRTAGVAGAHPRPPPRARRPLHFARE